MIFENIKSITIPEGEVKQIVYNGTILWEKISRYLKTITGKIITTTDALNEPAESLKVTLEPIQSGSGTPSPDNVRPISGHTEVDTEVCGVNLFDKTTADEGYIRDTNGEVNGTLPYMHTDYISVVPNATYYVKTEQTNGGWGAWYDSNKTFISSAIGWINNTLTAPSNARYVRLTCVSNASGNLDTFAVNYPSTDHDYHAYDGTSYTTTLGRTVYGGTLDVVSGELVVDRAMVDLSTLTWLTTSTQTADGSQCHYADVSGMATDTANTGMISDRFSLASGKYISTMVEGTMIRGGGKIYVATDADTISGQLCYPLATPQTYQLDPQTISLLHGNNNVWSDGSVEVTYWGTEQSN